MSDLVLSGSSLNGANMNRTGYSFNTVTLPSGMLCDLKKILEFKIAPYKEVYLNSPVVVDISDVKDLQIIDYEGMTKLCREYGLYLIGLSGASTEERVLELARRNIPVVNSTKFARIREENFKPRGVTNTLEVKVPVHIPVPYEVKVPVEVKTPDPVMVISRNIRAGELISAPDNSVVIFGTVARTAKIVASHNIIILGDLLGEVYAGSPKNAQTEGYSKGFIYVSGMFMPTLVAVAGHYQTADDIENSPYLQSIYGVHGQVVVSLNGKTLNYCQAKDYQHNSSNN